ncbi:Hfq-related RNA-binding protein [Cyanobacterium sp. Dongsha4]|uniref:Hfq-related RNA-binding protein n=1 Tax=Cyanobacterium sp. DS4 TaxID=2878255 RepID=UPI002E7FEEEB|nr:RNA-binding protein hfq [Cyanobacterium sp. Dongsha4]WVL02138.1 RNA-binding protein hfq [Cyanobacterium sp. Dongsha4]
MTAFDTGFPSVRQIQSFIKNKTPVEIGLMTNKTLEGVLKWQDQNCLSLVTTSQEKILVWIQAIAYIRYR